MMSTTPQDSHNLQFGFSSEWGVTEVRIS